MAKRAEIDAAILVSPKLAVIGFDETCVLLDVDRKSITHTCTVEGRLRDASLSPTGRQIALGLSGGYPVVWTLKTKKLVTIDTTMEIDGEMQSMGGWTAGAYPLAWIDASKIVFAAAFGGVIVATPSGESQAAKFSEGELWLDDQIDEHRMNDSFWSSYDDGKVYEIIDDDSFQIYSVGGREIRLLEHSTPPGKLVRHSALFVCGELIFQIGDAIAKVWRKSDREIAFEHRTTPHELIFSDREQTRVFAYRRDAFFVFDPETGRWSGCAKAKSVLGASAAGKRLLVRHKHTIAIIDLTTGKTSKLDPSKLA